MNYPNPIDECLIIPSKTKSIIRTLYNDPDRKYHNTEHICKIWHYYLNNNPGHHNWHERIKITTIFHDVIYNVGSHSNEVESADYMIDALGVTLNSTSVFAEIYDTIVATANHISPENDDLPIWSQMFLDLDLYELGSDEATYKNNSLKLLDEALNKYSSNPLTMSEALALRKSWLIKMLDAPRIFRYFTDREAQARINLEQNLKELI